MHWSTANKVKATYEVKLVKEVKNTTTPIEKHKSIGKLGQAEFNLIASPSGWLDCVIIHEAPQINGFQRPTLGPVRQFDIMTGDFIQFLHINNNHWVCMSSIDYLPGHVNLLDSISSPVISQEVRASYEFAWA